eukprot:6179320-Pleurochrysis_carterae.AAC.1
MHARRRAGEILERQLESVMFAPLRSVVLSSADETDPATRLSQVQAELQAWQAKFRQQHGRRPSHADMAADTTAAAILESFRAVKHAARSTCADVSSCEHGVLVAPRVCEAIYASVTASISHVPSP